MEKSKIMLHGYKHLYSLHNNRRQLRRKDVKTRFDTSNYELDRPIPNGKKLKK